ncbi:MAG: hypothetical protein HY093_04390 [Candidatus Liptonbacteria bacterium]|nr:hypothetical protein [Candidatus Liptonbacteria bacterium]
MNPNLKKIIAVALSSFIIFVAHYGSYRPLRKAQLFIETMRTLNEATTLDELKSRISAPLDFHSPFGQEELVRQVGSLFTNILSQPNVKPEVIADLMNYLSQNYDPIIQSGRGMSFNQNLYLLGSLNELAFLKTQQVNYLAAAKKYYLSSYELGPKRPQVLFGLFDVYRVEGNVSEVKRIADQILNQWPNEERTKKALEDFMAKVLTKKK